MSQSRSFITRIFSRSRDQTNNNEENYEEEIRRITEEKKAAEAQLELTQDKLHREQDRAHGLEIDYRRQSVELREAGVAREELINDRRKLEDQLRKKNEEFIAQEEELMKLKRDNQHLAVQLTEAQMKLQEQSRSHEEELMRVRDEATIVKSQLAESEGNFNLERLAFEERFKRLDSAYEQLEKKYIALNQENQDLCQRNHKAHHPPAPDVPKVNHHDSTRHVGKTHECWKLSVIDLLRKCDDLLTNMASNLMPSRINGSTSDWIHLCEKLKVNSESLFHVDPNERLINIIQQHQQQTDGPAMTVRYLYDTLRSINAKRAAALLRRKALYVYEQRKRLASESQTQASHWGYQRHYGKHSASFTYGSGQDALFVDSLSESDAEVDADEMTTVAMAHSITRSAIQTVSLCLTTVNEIHTLNLSSCFMDDDRFTFLVERLLQNHRCKPIQGPPIHTINISQNKLTSLSVDRLARLMEISKTKILNASNNHFKGGIIKHLVDNSTLITLDLSGNQMEITEMIQIAQLALNSASLQELNISNNAKIFCTEAEFIIDVILSVNSKLSEVIISDTNMRPRFSNYSKILSNNFTKGFSLQHLYIANKFPLYLSHSYMFEENFITSLDNNKKFAEVKEKCPLDDTTIFIHYVDHKGGVYYYKDHDVALFIPPGAILQGEWAEIKVSSSFYGQFHMPENYNRISSYVWVGANYDFKVPVYLIINHFVNMKSVKDIKTLTAFEACKLYSGIHDNETLTMQEITTNYFDTDLKYCVISTDHFCTYCLAELQTSSNEDSSHKEFLSIYYHYEKVKPNAYIAEICCLYFNNNCFKNVEKQFDGIKPEHSRDFLMHNGQHLGLEFEKPEPSSEWSVTINQEKIKYNEFSFQHYSNNVDLLKHKEDLRIYPPRFKLWCFKNKAESITSFNRTLSLKLMEGSNTIEQIYDVPFTTGPASGCSSDPTVGDIDQAAVISPNSLASSEPRQSETTTHIMNTKPEMWDVIKIVFPKIKSEWKYVAYSMRYAPYDVKTFENDALDSKGSCLKLFTDWLTTSRGITPKTWHKLIEHIKDVEELQNVAESIEEEVKKLYLTT